MQGEARNQGQGDINHQNTIDELLSSAMVELLRDGGQLHGGHLRLTVGARRKHDGDQGDHADAANPRGGDPPKQDTLRQGLDIGQDGRSRRGEPRHGLEQGVDEVELVAVKHEGQGPEQTGHHPATRDDEIPVLDAYRLTRLGGDQANHANRQSDPCRDQQGPQAAVHMVQESHQGRDHHHDDNTQQGETNETEGDI